jgi:ABC-2 type transport system permease protein
MRAEAVVLRHDLRVLRRSSLAWIAGLALTGAITAVGYQRAYPTQAERDVLGSTIAANPAFQALYGRAVALGTLDGFTTWRVGGLLVVLAAAWGLTAATRLLRGEEESGRGELLAVAPLSRRAGVAVPLAALAIDAVVLVAAETFALAASGVGVAASTAIAVAIAGGFAFGVGLGALAAQLSATRRRAASLAGIALLAALACRIVADGTRTLGWLRWCTPLGWIEEHRTVAGVRGWPLVLAVGFAAALAALAVVLGSRRDLGAALVGVDHGRDVRRRGLSSVVGFAARDAIRSAVTWSVALGALAALLGILAVDVAAFARSQANLAGTFTRFGVGGLDRPQDFLGFSFVLLAMALAVHAVLRIGAMREEEAEGRLDAILVRPVGRARWLAARVGVLVAGVIAVAVAVAVAAWAGQAARGAGVGLGELVAAGLDLVPVALAFAGMTTAVFGIAPRLTLPVGIGLALGSLLVQLIGGLLDAPSWVLDLSLFHHVVAAPAVAVRALPAVLLTALGVASCAAGVVAFARRDLAPDR